MSIFQDFDIFIIFGTISFSPTPFSRNPIWEDIRNSKMGPGPLWPGPISPGAGGRGSGRLENTSVSRCFVFVFLFCSVLLVEFKVSLGLPEVHTPILRDVGQFGENALFVYVLICCLRC